MQRIDFLSVILVLAVLIELVASAPLVVSNGDTPQIRQKRCCGFGGWGGPGGFGGFPGGFGPGGFGGFPGGFGGGFPGAFGGGPGMMGGGNFNKFSQGSSRQRSKFFSFNTPLMNIAFGSSAADSQFSKMSNGMFFG